jgi:outer membrane protein assembly factor BamB
VGGEVVFGLDGTLYGSQGSPYAINPANGQLIMNTSLWGNVSAPAIGPDGTVYAVYGTSFCALNPQSLDLEWSVQLDTDGGGQVTFGLNGEIIVNGEGTVYGISPRSHAIDWSCACSGGGATIGSTGVVYLANPFATSVFAAAVSPSGAVLWQNSTLPQYSSSRLVEDGKGNLFTMGGDGRLYALSAATGFIEWSSSQICQAGNSANNGCDVSLDSAGNLYFEGLDLVTGNQSAYAFNVGTRTVNWEVQIDGQTSRSYEKPAVAANGIVYFAAWNGGVYAIETATGHVNWSINVGAGVGLIGAREVEIGGDGTVYVETFNGNALIAIK